MVEPTRPCDRCGIRDTVPDRCRTGISPVRVLHRPSRPLCPCGNGSNPWVRRARNPGSCETVRPPVRPSKFPSGRVRRNRLERPTSGVMFWSRIQQSG